jgi:hypothetical protein
LVKEAIPEGIGLDKVDIWFQDESRVGQQGTQTRIWAKRGTRPRIVKFLCCIFKTSNFHEIHYLSHVFQKPLS